MTKVLDKQIAIVELFKALKVKLQKKWAEIPQHVICDSCKSFFKCLQLIIDFNGRYEGQSISNETFLITQVCNDW